MFANFIYFIIALLIYSTYQPSDTTTFTLFQSLFLCLLLTSAYTAYTWRQFQALNRKMASHGHAENDSRFTSLLTRQSIVAIFIFAANIYGLNLSSFVSSFGLFILFPTLQAVLFIWSFYWLSVHSLGMCASLLSTIVSYHHGPACLCGIEYFFFHAGAAPLACHFRVFRHRPYSAP